MKPLDIVTERVCRNGHPDEEGTPTPLLQIEEFFDGNSIIGSIGCNLESAPEPTEFYLLFQDILKRADVEDIRIQITAFDDPEWPFTDTVYIMTSATEHEILSWFPSHLEPDECWEGFVEQKYEPYMIPDGVRPMAVWWD